MSLTPRFRLFCGPNGSGKSSFYAVLKERRTIHTEIYVSADKLELEFNTTGAIKFSEYRIKADKEQMFIHIRNNGLFKTLENDQAEELLSGIELRDNELTFKSSIDVDSYIASFVATYIVECLILLRKSFCFETVMSHPDKLSILAKAKASGYKTYMYFLFASLPELNILRVKSRVDQGGHDVDTDKILERIPRTYNLMPIAFNLADEAYLINNDNEPFVAGSKVNNTTVINTKYIPDSILKILAGHKITSA